MHFVRVGTAISLLPEMWNDLWRYQGPAHKLAITLRRGLASPITSGLRQPWGVTDGWGRNAARQRVRGFVQLRE